MKGRAERDAVYLERQRSVEARRRDSRCRSHTLGVLCQSSRDFAAIEITRMSDIRIFQVKASRVTHSRSLRGVKTPLPNDARDCDPE